MHKKRLGKLATFAGILMLTSGICVRASETSMVSPKGYHEITSTENESQDIWYAVEKGTYIESGRCSVKDGGSMKVNVSGNTTAHSTCDRVYLGLYLDYSKDSGKTFSNAGFWTFVDEDTYKVTGTVNGYSATKGYWYMARGVHSVTKNGVTEGSTTATDAIVM